MRSDARSAYLAAIASDFGVFLRQAFDTVYAGKEFQPNWHVDAITHLLDLAVRGQRPRLILNLPPRFLKSFIVSVAFPAYLIGRDPSAKIICVSYSDELAKTLARDCRRILEAPWFRTVFPNARITKSTETEIVTDHGGGRYATSVGGTLTGRGGDVIIIDDPIKPEESHSEKLRVAVNEWYASTLLSRLDDKARSLLILVMQRVHVNDLTGYLEAGGEFVKLALPAIAIHEENIPISDTDVYRRSAGEALHSERESLELMGRLRAQIGEYNFLSQYQQQPQAPEGGMFKREWFRIEARQPQRQPDGSLCISVDTALGTSSSADFTAISVVYADVRGFWVLEAARGRWNYDELRAFLMQLWRRYQIEPIFIVEGAGVGISLISWLRNSGHVCLTASPRDAKQVRAAYALPEIHSGRVTLVGDPEQDEGWIRPYLDEFCAFPHGRFDDWVDSLTQLINWAVRRYGSSANARGANWIKEQETL